MENKNKRIKEKGRTRDGGKTHGGDNKGTIKGQQRIGITRTISKDNR